MIKLRSPIWRIGGKGRLVSKLLPLIPSHTIYVEPFCGGASLFFAKQLVSLEILNDIDRTLIGFFHMLRDPIKFEQFHKLVTLTPYSRVDYEDAYNWRDEPDELERLRKWFIINRQAFGGIYGRGWSHTVRGRLIKEGKIGTTAINYWLSIINLLPQIVERLRYAQIECIDYQVCLSKYDNTNTFFYLDPPYIPDTRTQPNSYKYEMSTTDHEIMVGLILKLTGKVLLSGYQHPIYDPLEIAGWQRQDFNYTQGGTLAKKGKLIKRIESVWFNYKLGGD